MRLSTIIAVAWFLGGCHAILGYEPGTAGDTSRDALLDLSVRDGVGGDLDTLVLDAGVTQDTVPPDAADSGVIVDGQSPHDAPLPDAPDTSVTPDGDGPPSDSLLSDAADTGVTPDGPAPDLPAHDSVAQDYGIACNPTVNLALQATATSIGGGTAKYGPENMNDTVDESKCFYHWIQTASTPIGAWIQLEWATPQLVGSMFMDTVNVAGTSCVQNYGRNIAGGTLQYWSGGQWFDIMTISGRTDDWSVSFPPVLTTRLRLFDAVSTQLGAPAVFEWEVFCQ